MGSVLSVCVGITEPGKTARIDVIWIAATQKQRVAYRSAGRLSKRDYLTQKLWPTFVLAELEIIELANIIFSHAIKI
jgi:hypothetical protein